MTHVRDRALNALLGLAAGDATGLPAQFHRQARSAWAREAGWKFSAALDEQRVSRPLLPFTLGAGDPVPLSCTDDAETAAIASLVLLQCEEENSQTDLFSGWLDWMGGDDVWTGVAERSAVINAARGLVPPATGNDNPEHWSDGAVPAGVPIGIRYAGDPATAAEVAGRYARISHAADGVWATQAMARAIAALVSGVPLAEALADAASSVPDDSWLSRNLAVARRIRGSAATPFEAVPDLVAELAPAVYSHACVATETLPVAFVLAELSGGDLPTALGAAALVSRQSDSMPAMVGAVCGAAGAVLPESWRRHVDEVPGVLNPRLKGIRLSDLADRLTAFGNQ
ncbi:ADP-ribosylglycohydrolase family protein [Streptomyces sp. NPDC004629]|uniref:ADP-ribosylglycohydrolase family protein n=1 Tax=Streptomyces sp. NPDC004629 TaxID=3364705 RepID=UPI00367DB450